MKPRKPLKLKFITITIPEEVRKHAASFLGDDITTEADFWSMVLRDGLRAYECQFNDMLAEYEKFLLGMGTPLLVDPNGDDDLDDEIPF